LALGVGPFSSTDVGLHTACQAEQFVIRQRKDGLRDAARSPQLVELGERTIDNRTNRLWVADRSDTSDRLVSVFAYKRRSRATKLTPKQFTNLGHVDSMRATGHD
jgi:hypothetical protein